MKKRRFVWLVWLLTALSLYFFENNTGTRIVLACSLLLPLISALCAVWCADRIHFDLSVSGSREHLCHLHVSGSILLAGCIPTCKLRAENIHSGEATESCLLSVDPDTNLQLSVCAPIKLKISLADTAVKDRFGLFRIPIRHSETSTILITADSDTPSGEDRNVDSSAYTGIREYVPGDPVRLIHWKLSAKTDKLLIRETEKTADILAEWEDTFSQNHVSSKSDSYPDEMKVQFHPETGKRELSFFQKWIFSGLFCTALLLLFAVPAAFNGLKTLFNRLFTASEAVNSYAYSYFDVPANQTVLPAVVLLFLALLSLLGIIIRSRNAILILLCAMFTAAGQAYFGVSCPVWLNILIFSFFGILLVRGKLTSKILAFFLLSVTLIASLILTQYPGVDPWIETRSETLRDRLTITATIPAYDSGTDSAEILETRHVNSRSLITGEGNSMTQREFRPITKDQEQISLPEWIKDLPSLLPIILITIPALVLVVLLTRMALRRIKAKRERGIFDSPDRSEAIIAMFRHIADWLEAFGYGCGNLPYRDWVPTLAQQLPENYVNQFGECVPDFEAALYSDREPDQEQWSRVKSLLNETETLLYRQADRGKRLRLKYAECLYP